MASPRLLTFSDALDALTDFASSYGGTPSQAAMRQIVMDSYTEFASVRDWSYLRVNGRLQLQAALSTGTVVYTHSTRTLVLTGSTWPADIEDWCVRFGGVVCDVETRTSDAAVVLDPTMNPGKDVASTTYLAYPRWYKLPGEFVSMSRPMDENNWYLGKHIDMESMLALDRYEEGSGDVQFYSFGPVQDQYGYTGVYVWPPASTSQTYDYIGRRLPRNLRYSGKDTADSAGTVAVTAGSKAVVGTSTSFDSMMVGSVFRIGSSTTNAPTRVAGQYPYLEEHTIKSVTDATHLTLGTAIATTRSGVKCLISDPIDIPPLLHPAFVACAKKNLAFERNMKDRLGVLQEYTAALFRAKCADSPVGQTRVVGERTVFVSRLADGKIGVES